MKALVYDGMVRLEPDYPNPAGKPGWALLRVTRAGICRTDLELSEGYMGFRGVLGHEFTALVEEADDSSWIGKRVVGEINAACGTCAYCRKGLGRHCPDRNVLGITGLDGCLAEFCTLPLENLHEIPGDLSDDEAVFLEPLSAAFEILDQVNLNSSGHCLVLGDGKLGILCAWVLSTVVNDVTLVGHHEEKLALAEWNGVKVSRNLPAHASADVVVEASGSTQGFEDAMRLCRPRGILVLKSTIATQGELNLAPIVIDELSVVGSRCGRFEAGLKGLQEFRFPVGRLISARYPIAEAEQAFKAAGERNALKVLIDM